MLMMQALSWRAILRIPLGLRQTVARSRSRAQVAVSLAWGSKFSFDHFFRLELYQEVRPPCGGCSRNSFVLYKSCCNEWNGRVFYWVAERLVPKSLVGIVFPIVYLKLSGESSAAWRNGIASDYDYDSQGLNIPVESGDCRFDPCGGH
jgi:hypothetical protein